MKNKTLLSLLLACLCALPACFQTEKQRKEQARLDSVIRKQAVDDSLAYLKEKIQKDSIAKANGGASNTAQQSSYEMADAINKMNVVFVGNPSETEIKELIEGVMQKWNLEKTNDQALKIANALVVMRKESKVGVTEMEILKYIYQLGDTKLKLGDAIGLAATMLELRK